MYGCFFNGKHVRGEGEGDKGGEGGEGASQGTCTEDSWAWVMGGDRLQELGVGQGRARGGGGTTVTEQ